MDWLYEFFTLERSLWICAIFGGIYIVTCILEAIVKRKQKRRDASVKRCTGGDPHDGGASPGTPDGNSASE